MKFLIFKLILRMQEWLKPSKKIQYLQWKTAVWRSGHKEQTMTKNVSIQNAIANLYKPDFVWKAQFDVFWRTAISKTLTTSRSIDTFMTAISKMYHNTDENDIQHTASGCCYILLISHFILGYSEVHPWITS